MKQCTYCGKEYTDDTLVCAIDEQPLRDLSSTSLDASGSNMNDKMRDQHSGLGIASFGISVVVGCLMLASFVVAGILSSHRNHGDARYPGQIAVGLIFIALMAADVVAVGLGIAAVCESGKKRLFGILGLVFSGATLLGTVGLMIIGLIYASRFIR